VNSAHCKIVICILKRKKYHFYRFQTKIRKFINAIVFFKMSEELKLKQHIINTRSAKIEKKYNNQKLKKKHQSNNTIIPKLKKKI